MKLGITMVLEYRGIIINRCKEFAKEFEGTIARRKERIRVKILKENGIDKLDAKIKKLSKQVAILQEERSRHPLLQEVSGERRIYRDGRRCRPTILDTEIEARLGDIPLIFTDPRKVATQIGDKMMISMLDDDVMSAFDALDKALEDAKKQLLFSLPL